MVGGPFFHHLIKDLQRLKDTRATLLQWPGGTGTFQKQTYSDKETDHLLWTIMSRQQPCTARESYYISR